MATEHYVNIKVCTEHKVLTGLLTKSHVKVSECIINLQTK